MIHHTPADSLSQRAAFFLIEAEVDAAVYPPIVDIVTDLLKLCVVKG